MFPGVIARGSNVLCKLGLATSAVTEFDHPFSNVHDAYFWAHK